MVYSGNTTAATLVSDYSADSTTTTYLRRAAVVPGQNQSYNLTGKAVSGLTVSSVNYLAKVTPYGTSYTNLWFSNGPNYGTARIRGACPFTAPAVIRNPAHPMKLIMPLSKSVSAAWWKMAAPPLYLQAIWQQLQAGRADSVQWQQDAFWRSQLSGEYPVHPGWRCLARTPEIPGYFPGGDR
jgi:hypothetical protein